jgi:hypothetical protein
VENKLEPIEFELVVYIRNRNLENLEDFLKEYWTDESKFLTKEEDFEVIFQMLARQITWDKNFNKDFRISSIATLFKNTKTKQPSKKHLKKYSYFEFLSRTKSENEVEEARKPFLSNVYKFGTFDLSNRRFKIIDYGNCYDYSDERYGLINTRQYRAPEVILSKT